MLKPDTCRPCVLFQKYECKGFIQPEGAGTLGVMIVGEAAGAAEAADGLPFRPYAESGSVLERVWSRCGWNRSQFRITNILHCRPPNNALEGEKYETAAIAACKQYLDDEIREFKPRAILALGGVAARTLTGFAGAKQGIQSIRGFVVPARDYPEIPVIPSLHPAFLRRGKMAWLSLLIQDMQRAVSVARDGAPQAPPAKYTTSASLADLEAFRDDVRAHPELLLAYDIETDYSMVNDENEVVGDGSNIVLVQFSLRPGTGIAIPWEAQAVPLLRDVLASPNRKVAHNGWMFDNPMLEAHGVPVTGHVQDSMWAWHHLQPDLPRGLQSVVSLFAPQFGPWKHLSGVDLQAYGCKDVDVLQTIWPKIELELRAKGLWDGYERHVRSLWPILQRVSVHGLPIDATEQEALRAYLEEQKATVDARLQAAYPPDLKNVDPKLGFAKTPKDTSGMVQREFEVPYKVKVPCHCTSPEGEVFKLVPKCPACKGRGLIRVPGGTRVETRWARLLPYKASSQQLIRYIRSRGHKVPKAIGEDKDSTSKLFIERLFKDTKDPFYNDNLDYRAYDKQLGSYMWTAGPDGHCHAKFTFSPATGQLAAQEPNILTIPAPKGKSKKDELAVMFRKTIKAKPGHVMLECIDPGVRLLMDDFTWKEARYVRPDDQIVGFDEHRTPSGKRSGRKLRKSVVYSVRRLVKSRVRIKTDMGEIISSVDHLWLSNNGHNAQWIHAKDLVIGNTISYFTKPWETNNTAAGNYLAGFLDGEGYISKGRGVVGFGQNTGDTLDHVCSLVHRFTDFDLVLEGERLYAKTGKLLRKLVFNDGLAFTGMRVVGSLRPVRLLKRLRESYPGTSVWGKNTKCATIQSVEVIEDGEVMAIETTTHTFIADGFLSHNCDMSGFHTSTFALEARDPVYFRLANKLRDPHSFLTAAMLHLEKPETLIKWDDEKLQAYFAQIKRDHKAIRDGQAKPAILGYALGLGGNKLYEQNRYDPDTKAGFRSRAEADRLIATLRSIFPMGYRYQNAVRILAHNQGYLKNRWGYIRWFWDVLSHDPRTKELGQGEQANDAIAFNVQADAHGYLKDAILRMDALGYLERYGLCNIVHDSVVFECPLGLLEEAIANVVVELERPCVVLTDPDLCPAGLVVAAEPKVGWSMADMTSPEKFLSNLRGA